jgi:hypothetical protein
MFRWLLILLCLCSALQATRIEIEVTNLNEPSRLALHNLGYDIPASATEWKIITDDTSLSQFDGIPYSVIRDVRIDGYRSYSVLSTEMSNLAQTYPDICRLSSLGPSRGAMYADAGDVDYHAYAGNQVWCIKISDNPDVEEDEPNVYLSGNIHGNEMIAQEVTMDLLLTILEGYGTIDSITAMVNDNQIWMIPLINPDGQVYTWNSIQHRKNLRDGNANGIPDSSDGVDLNRNFGVVWGPNGTSSDPNSTIYNGPEPWSEPEVIYLRDLLREHNFWGGITYHSSGEWVLYPLGHLPGDCALDASVMNELAVRMAMMTPALQNDHYTPAQAVDFGYTCQGTMGDWGYAEQRLFSFTIELAQTYIPPATQVPTICDANRPAALMFVNRPKNAMITGHITDTEGNPVVADIHVREIDEQTGMTIVSPVQSDAMFGRYYRMLLPGTYHVVFRANGDSIEVNEVTVRNDSVTVLDAVFESTHNSSATAPEVTSRLRCWPNPFNPELHLDLSLSRPGHAQLNVYDLRGRHVHTLVDSHLIAGTHSLTWNGTNDEGHPLASGVYLLRCVTPDGAKTIKTVLLR